MKINAELIAGNANSTYNNISWSPKGEHFAFGCSNNIHLYDCKANKVVLSLRGHEKRVNTTRFVASSIYSALLLSAGSDGKMIIWRNNSKISDYKGWSVLAQEKVGENTTTLTLLETGNDEFYVASHDTTGEVRVYRYSAEKLSLLSTLHFGNNVQASGSLAILEGNLLLFVGGLDFKIHLYNIPTNAEAEAEYKLSLKGHENAITSLEITNAVNIGGDSYRLLASASKDGYIRLWRVGAVSQAQ